MGMPWYKHKTNTLDDPRMQAFVHDYGCMAYALWCAIIETICGHGDQVEIKDGRKKDLTWESPFHIKALASRLKLDDVDKVESVVRKMFEAYGVELLSEDGVWRIRYQEMITLRDDYTRRKKKSKVSEQDQNSVRQDKEEDKEEDPDLEEKRSKIRKNTDGDYEW